MTDDRAVIDEPTSDGPSRRTIMKGVAWAAPVIAVAAIAPQAAASVPPCSPSTTNSLTSWGVNSEWPTNTHNCGQHADVVFIFQAPVACGATSVEIVMGLPGTNDGTDRGAIWIWSTPTSNVRGNYGYILTPGSAASNQGGIAVPAGGITVPKYRQSPAATAGWRDAHTEGTVNDGIHVAIYNYSGSACVKVNTVLFHWYWRELTPVVGPWYHMQNTLTIGNQGQISLGAPVLLGPGAPGTYTPIA